MHLHTARYFSGIKNFVLCAVVLVTVLGGFNVDVKAQYAGLINTTVNANGETVNLLEADCPNADYVLFDMYTLADGDADFFCTNRSMKVVTVSSLWEGPATFNNMLTDTRTDLMAISQAALLAYINRDAPQIVVLASISAELARGLPATPGTQIVILSGIARNPFDLTTQPTDIYNDFVTQTGQTPEAVAAQVQTVDAAFTAQDLMWVWGEWYWPDTGDIEDLIAAQDWAGLSALISYEIINVDPNDPYGLDFAMNIALTGVDKTLNYSGMPYDQFIPYNSDYTTVANISPSPRYNLAPFPAGTVIISFTGDAVTGFDQNADCVVDYRVHAAASVVAPCLQGLSQYERVQLINNGQGANGLIWIIQDISPANPTLSPTGVSMVAYYAGGFAILAVFVFSAWIIRKKQV